MTYSDFVTVINEPSVLVLLFVCTFGLIMAAHNLIKRWRK